MKKQIFPAILFLAAFSLMADFPTDFQNAQKQFNQRKWEKAAAAFAQTAENAPAAYKDKCYSYAARALASARKQNEAEGMAARIANPEWKSYTRMEILSTLGKFNELVTQFRTEKIDGWPEEIAYLGHYMLGRALASSRNATEAVAELEKAVAQAGSDERTRILALSSLVQAAQKNGDTAKALAAADKALSMKSFRGFSAYLDAALRKTQILIAQKKFDEAEKNLDALDAGRKWNGGDWQLQYLETRGDLAAAKGNSAEARRYYAQALEVGETHPYFKNRVKGKLGKIR